MALCRCKCNAVRCALPRRRLARTHLRGGAEPLMKIPEKAKLLRIFIGESDRWHHQPLYEAIVLAAREAGLAGATVLRGPMGFGQSSRLHTTKILQLSQDLPLIIEIVDAEDAISAFTSRLDGMMGSGLITLEKVQVLKYGVASGDAPV